MKRDSFEWLNQQRGVVVKKQLAVAIERRENGDLVLIQEAWSDQEEDIVIILEPEGAIAVGTRLLELTGKSAPANAPKDRTAAERQRRHRDKRRDVTGRVTLDGITGEGKLAIQ